MGMSQEQGANLSGLARSALSSSLTVQRIAYKVRLLTNPVIFQPVLVAHWPLPFPLTHTFTRLPGYPDVTVL